MVGLAPVSGSVLAPHQFSVAVMVEPVGPWKSRFLPAIAVLPWRRLYCMLKPLPVLIVFTLTPPPKPVPTPAVSVAVFPVMLTLEMVPTLVPGMSPPNQTPPPSPPELLLLTTDC